MYCGSWAHGVVVVDHGLYLWVLCGRFCVADSVACEILEVAESSFSRLRGVYTVGSRRVFILQIRWRVSMEVSESSLVCEILEVVARLGVRTTFGSSFYVFTFVVSDNLFCAWNCPVVELSSYCGVVQSKAPVYRNSKDMKEGKEEVIKS